MADIINIQDFIEDSPDIYSMDREELKEYLITVRQQIAELDDREPKDMYSDEYEVWGDAHEDLEDLEDEIMDILDSMG